jgi:outer membrane protein assembly factor BamB
MKTCNILKTNSLIILSIIFLTYLGELEAQDSIWPQFRGINCSGIAAENQNPPIEFGPTRNVLWKTSVPSGHSSPCIWGNHIFLTGFDEEKKEFSVFCINRSNGEKKWSQIVAIEKIERVNSLSSPATATPATDGERVYVYFGSFGLICYNFVGKQLWTVPLPIPKTTHGMGTSPIVSGELVILNNDDQNDPNIMAVDRRSGKMIWKQPQPILSKTGQACHSTPVVWQNQLIMYRRGEIVAFNSENGERVWWFVSLTGGTSTPVIGNDILFVGTYTLLGDPKLHIKLPDYNTIVNEHDKNGDLLISKEEFPENLTFVNRPEMREGDGQTQFKKVFTRFDSNKDNFLDSTEWGKFVDVFITEMMTVDGLVAIKLGGNGDITATNLLWREIKAVPEVPSPLFYNGLVYMIKNGGIVSCMNAKSGKLLYRERFGASGPYFSSPITASGRIYIASLKGIITVFEAGDQLNIIAKNEMNERIYATPAVVDNTLYVRTTKHLYAFGK